MWLTGLGGAFVLSYGEMYLYSGISALIHCAYPEYSLKL